MNQVEPIAKYDANGKLIYYRSTNGYEFWYKYDANGNWIYRRDSDGKEYWYWEWQRTQDPIKILLLQKRIRDEAASI